MAASSSSSSSTSSSQLKKLNIFISFRGEDIRQGFLPFLCEALKEKGADPFTDEKLLEGEQITAALEQAIRDSLISIVIFSKNYADSPWCLDELVVIDDCRVKSNQLVLPIFYRVDTDDVQGLPPDGTFAKALQRLIETYPHRIDSLKEWRRVLKTISGHTKGWVATSNSKYFKLKVLDLSYCKRLRNLPNLPCLKSFSASNCISLKFASCSFLSLEDDQEEEKEYDYDQEEEKEYDYDKTYDVMFKREPQCLDFGNCINLDNDVCLRIMEDVLSAYPDKKEFRLCIPGVEVLPRMRYQTSGFHLSFKLEKHDDIMGFCFCAVINPQYTKKHFSHVTCSAIIQDESRMMHYFDFPDGSLGFMDTNHVFLWYKTFHCKEHFMLASFHFFIDAGYRHQDYGPIIKCGVHIIFRDEYMKSKYGIPNFGNET